MDTLPLVKAFTAIGAPVRLENRRDGVRLNVVPVRRRETFTVAVAPDVDVRVLNIDAAARHLLLFAAGERYLCGHDERHWFVAAIADRVSTVRDAKRSLLPPALRDVAIRTKDGDRRRNAAYVRQGEWFFVPDSPARLAGMPILQNEPLMRPRSKPHQCEEIIRFGGEIVHLVGRAELSDIEYRQRILHDPSIMKQPRRTLVKNPEVYVRGRVRHPDHATITLPGWHRVYLNNEFTSTPTVQFYD